MNTLIIIITLCIIVYLLIGANVLFDEQVKTRHRTGFFLSALIVCAWPISLIVDAILEGSLEEDDE